MRTPTPFHLLLALAIGLPALAADWQSVKQSADTAFSQGKYSAAETLYDQALNAAAAFGQTDDRYLQTVIAKIKLYYAENRLVDAEPLFQTEISLLEKRFGADNPSVITAKENYK